MDPQIYSSLFSYINFLKGLIFSVLFNFSQNKTAIFYQESLNTPLSLHLKIGECSSESTKGMLFGGEHATCTSARY